MKCEKLWRAIFKIIKFIYILPNELYSKMFILNLTLEIAVIVNVGTVLTVRFIVMIWHKVVDGKLVPVNLEV
jgi:hypothetical protein